MPAQKYAEIVKSYFGPELTALRKARGLSKNQLSERSGVARSFITYLENGERFPSLETLSKIAHALGIPPSELTRRAELEAGPVPPFKMDPDFRN